jgi:hypothetical protein
VFAEKDKVSLYQKQEIDSFQISYLKLMKEVDKTSYILTGTEHFESNVSKTKAIRQKRITG